MIQTDLKDKMMPFKMIWNAIYAVYIEQNADRLREIYMDNCEGR